MICKTDIIVEYSISIIPYNQSIYIYYILHMYIYYILHMYIKNIYILHMYNKVCIT